MDSDPTGPAFYEALGRAIQVHRARHGLDRKELARRAEVSYPYLSEIENGKKRPSSSAVLAIAEALGLRASELLEEAESLVGDVVARHAMTLPDLVQEAHDLAPIPDAEAPTRMAATMPLASAVEGSAPRPRRSWFRGQPEPGTRSQPSPSGPRDELMATLSHLAAGLSEDDLRRLVDLAGRLRG
jgi:transcriptional regulator with XRE-family HTH domain